MENKKKKGFRKYIPWAVLGLVVLLLALMPVLARNAAAGAEATVLQATAQTGEVENTLAGGGTLTAEDALEVQVPATVEITEFLVENGDRVEAGQPLAKVDRVSLMSAVTEVQESLESVSKKMYNAFNGATAHYINAKAPGRVKAVYARRDDEAARVVLEHGALAVISLDGLMKAEIETALPVHAGDSLVMRLPDGKEYPGRVETALNGKLTVNMTDNGPPLGETVTAFTKDGDEVGSGVLQVHSAWNVLATDGTVFEVNIRENQEITDGWNLFALKDLSGSAEYLSLAAQHREYEALMQDLFALYTDDTVKAPEAGFVSGIDKDLIKKTAAGDQKPVLKLLAEEPTSFLIVSINGDGTVSGFYFAGSPTTEEVTQRLMLFSAGLEQPQTLKIPEKTVPENYSETMSQYDLVTITTIDGGEAMVFSGVNFGSLTMPPTPSFSIPDLSGFAITLPAEPEKEDELYSLEKTTIMKVTPDKIMTVSIDVDELDILRYEPGMKADVVVDALPDRSFTAEVEEIAAVGENAGGNSKYTVKLRLDRAPDMLDGMNASVIVHRGVTTGLLLPVEAVYDRGSHSYVYTGLDNKSGNPTGELEIQTGVSDGLQVEIVSGLTEGQTVYYKYYLPVTEDKS